MKILRLDLRAFGRFSHEVFNFDPKKKIHIIYGENEAGKSSFSRALKALLFGIEKKSKDAYLHPQENLFIEGLLEDSSGKIVQVLRDNSSSRKQNQILETLFPKLSKESFTRLFCLNQETIRMGSKDLLENIQHFDLSLFSSLQGADGVVKLLKSIEADVDELFKARGVKPLINQKIQIVSDLLEEQKNLKLSLNQWEEIKEEKRSLLEKLESIDKDYRVFQDLNHDLKTLTHIYDLLPKYLDCKKVIQEIDIKDLIGKEDLVEYKENRLSFDQLEKQIEETNKFIQNLNKQISLNEYNQEIIDLKSDLEVLLSESQNYAIWNAQKSKNEEELLKLKANFKQINLTLQEKINISLSFEKWQEIRVELVKLIEDLKVITCLRSDKLNQISIQKSKLEELKSRSTKIPVVKDIKQMEREVQEFDEGISIEKQLEESKSGLESLIMQLNESDLINKNLSLKDLKRVFLGIKEMELTESEIYQFKNNYLQTLKTFQFYDKKVLKLKEHKETTPSIDLESYFKLKKERQELKAKLFKTWTASNYLEKYALFIKYQEFIDKEDIKEAYFFSNIDKLAVEKKLIFDIQENQKELEIAKNSLDHLVETLKKWTLPFNSFFKSLDFFHSGVAATLIDFLEGIRKIQKEVHAFDQLTQKLSSKRKKLSKYFKEETSFSQGKKSFLILYEDRKKLFCEKSELEKQISFISESIKILENDYKKLIEQLSSLQKDWKKLSEKNGIKIEFSPIDMTSVVHNLDNFFDLSKIITVKNDLVKSDLKLVQRFELELKKIRLKLGFTDFDEKDIRLYIRKSNDESNKKNKKEQLLFLRENKLKDIDILKDRKSSAEKKLEFLTQKMELNNHRELAERVEYSESRYLLLEKYENMDSQLKLRCKPKELNYYLGLTKNYSTRECLDNQSDSINEKLTEIEKDKETIQKKIGEVIFLETQVLTFTKKYELDEKLQTETFELNEKIEEYLVAKSSAKILHQLIWDFQQKNQDYLLKIASSFFQKMTNRRYKDVQLNILNQKESFLICQNNENEKVTIDLLSEGTRDQLFLALKLAMGKLYQKKSSFPLLLDDVLVNFDNERSLNTLKLLAEISESSQIIFLTHHQHILDLIEKCGINNHIQVHNLNSYSQTLA